MDQLTNEWTNEMDQLTNEWTDEMDQLTKWALRAGQRHRRSLHHPLARRGRCHFCMGFRLKPCWYRQ